MEAWMSKPVQRIRERRSFAHLDYSEKQTDLLEHRSKNRCEAKFQGYRCRTAWTVIHHRITRARGGRILDAYDEVAHLACLCDLHHRLCHDTGEGLAWFDDEPLILSGYVTTGFHGGPVISGSDHPTLSVKYGED